MYEKNILLNVVYHIIELQHWPGSNESVKCFKQCVDYRDHIQTLPFFFKFLRCVMCLWGDRNLVNAHCEGTGIWWMLIDKVYFSLYIQILPVNDMLTAIVLVWYWTGSFLTLFSSCNRIYTKQYSIPNIMW